jgi:hypothetical protein
MVISSDDCDPDCLGSSVSRAILEHLTQALEHASIDQLARPVLRIEAFIQDGDNDNDDRRTTGSPSRGRLIASVRSVRLSSLPPRSLRYGSGSR